MSFLLRPYKTGTDWPLIHTVRFSGRGSRFHTLKASSKSVHHAAKPIDNIGKSYSNGIHLFANFGRIGRIISSVPILPNHSRGARIEIMFCRGSILIHFLDGIVWTGHAIRNSGLIRKHGDRNMGTDGTYPDYFLPIWESQN